MVLMRVTAIALGAICLAAAVSVAVTAVTTPGCASCHSASAFVEQTAARSHADISCATCHVPTDVPSRLAFASAQVFSMTLQLAPSSGRAVAHVDDDRCLACHDRVLEETTSSRGYRIRHDQCAEGRQCVDCHSATAHGSAVTWVRVS
ncbi:MAG: hypothetical protein JXE06_07815, partial [Coriobacteriia bacterium]|nr:hypothetical protein [Coriobacteriia bacterium]